MHMADQPEKNIMLPMGAVLMLEPNGEWSSQMAPAVVDYQGVTVAIELDQCDVATLLNGGKLKIKVMGTTMPSIAVAVAK